jgi:hypothetical protein
MCTVKAIKSNITFWVSLWPIFAAIGGGFLYEIRTVDNLSVRITLLEKQFDRMDGKLDRVLIERNGGKENVRFSKQRYADDGKSAVAISRF